jgi:hypothetical protein
MMRRKTASLLNDLRTDVKTSMDVLRTFGDILDGDIFELTEMSSEDIRHDQIHKHDNLIEDIELTIKDLKLQLKEHKKCVKLHRELL